MILFVGAVFPASAEETPAPPKPFIVVEGQVTDALGAGQKDVKVELRRTSAEEVIVSTTTSALGDFAVTSESPLHGDFILTLSKTDFAAIVREIRREEGGAPVFLAETLEGDLTVSGQVLDAMNDQKIKDAKILVRVAGGERTATTDAEGRFAVKGVAPGEMELTVEAAGYGRECGPKTLPKAQTDVLVSLKPERIVHLRVVDEAGQPIAQAVVELLDQARSDFRQSVTADDGRATLRGLHFDAATLAIRLSHPGFVAGVGFDRAITVPVDGKESTHELTMIRSGVVSGRITSAATQEPLHGARITAGEEVSDAAPRAFSDAGGRFTLPGLSPGSVTLTVYRSDYAPELRIVEVKAGETPAQDIALVSPRVIEGAVQTDSGRPIRNVELMAVRWRSKGTLGVRAMTDDFGSFRIVDAPLDEFDVLIQAVGRENVTRTVPAEQTRVTLTVPLVVPSSGKPKPRLDVGDAMPEIVVKTLAGDTLNFGELKGKVVFVEFWATWCHPCLEEMPVIMDLHEKYGARKDFALVGISRDQDLKAVREYLQKNPRIAWPQVAGEAGGASKTCDVFGVNPVPDMVLIGYDGKVAARGLRGAKIGEAVEALLTGKSGG